MTSTSLPLYGTEAKRKISFYHAVHFEEWSPLTPDERGIGNSETCQIELCKRLAKRGWDVVSYAPVPWRGFREFDGVQWAHLEDADFSRDGYWMLFRRPEDLDQFSLPHPDQKCFVVAQDESFGGRWNDERIAKVDGVFALCNAHRESLERDDPKLSGKVLVSSNGLKMGLIKEIDNEAIERNPHRIMWASSPDRGLLKLAKIFRRLKEWVSDAELHCFYGFDNARKLEALGPQYAWFKTMREQIEKELDQPGVFWHGRVSQPDVIREWRKTGIMCYPTTFRETSCVSHMEAMANGAIPVCSPVWALGEHALGGSLIVGDPMDPMISSRFVSECFAWMVDTQRAEFTRLIMMDKARTAFDWERAVDLYEAHMLGYWSADRTITNQFNFQLKNCLGAKSILNVGCADDPGKLKAMGAVNLDSRREDPIFHKPTAADVYMDMRDLSGFGKFGFDRIVYGDCLEHFKQEDVPAILREGVEHLNPGGRIVITVPEDHRPPEKQHAGSDGENRYHDGVAACHLYPVTRSILDTWLKEAGLVAVGYQENEWQWYKNHGIVAMRKDEVDTMAIQNEETEGAVA